MAITALGPEILEELCVGCSSNAIPAVLDDLSLTIERTSLTTGGDVPSSTAIWIGRLRRIGSAKLNAWGLADLVDDAQLLISELVTNGFRHGAGRQVVFRLMIGVSVIVLEVDDGSAELPHLRDAALDAVNGRGLMLVDAVATRWGVSRDGTKTWCVLTTGGS